MNKQFKIIKNPVGNTWKVWYGTYVVITYSKSLNRLNFRFQRKFWTEFFTNVNLPTEEELTMFELEHGEEIANLVRKISSDNQELGFRKELKFKEKFIMFTPKYLKDRSLDLSSIFEQLDAKFKQKVDSCWGNLLYTFQAAPAQNG